MTYHDSMTGFARRQAVAVIAAALVLLFALLVWPTPYRYRTNPSPTPAYLRFQRTNRFTGTVHYRSESDPQQPWRQVLSADTVHP